MKKFVCTVCGYVHEGDAAPAECPVCHAGAEKFKEQTGDNFINYLTQRRVETAKQLLSDGRLNIKTICNEVGYNDPNYFSRLFKRFEGVTPTEYREQVLNMTNV